MHYFDFSSSNCNKFKIKVIARYTHSSVLRALSSLLEDDEVYVHRGVNLEGGDVLHD